MHVLHPMSERDYSCQPLSLHINSSALTGVYNRIIFLTTYLSVPPGVPAVVSAASSCPCSPRPAYWSMSTPSHSSLARASLFWEMNFSSVQARLFRLLISSSFVVNCVLDLRASDKRASYSPMIGHLKPAYPPHYGFSERPHFWLGKSITLAHEAFLSRSYFLTQAACRWLRSLQRTTP